MTDPTLTLIIEGGLEIHNEGEWSKTVSKYSAFNDAGVEVEVGEFIYGLVRVLKPELVLETGTHRGINASYIGMALRENDFGQLETLEFLPELHKQAKSLIERLKLSSIVAPLLDDATKFNPPNGHKYDLIFLDTEPQTRFGELLKYYLYLNEGGFFFIHDLHRHMQQVENTEHGFGWPFGKIPEQLKLLVKNGQLRPFHFPTPRGLTGFYKVSGSDYEWR